MPFVVHMERMIDRMIFQVGDEAGYVNDGHAPKTATHGHHQMTDRRSSWSAACTW
jgi:hypothetical protein